MSEDSNDTQTNIVSDNSDSTKFNLLFLAVLIDLLGFGIIIPILPFLVTTERILLFPDPFLDLFTVWKNLV